MVDEALHHLLALERIVRAEIRSAPGSIYESLWLEQLENIKGLESTILDFYYDVMIEIRWQCSECDEKNLMTFPYNSADDLESKYTVYCGCCGAEAGFSFNDAERVKLSAKEDLR